MPEALTAVPASASGAGKADGGSKLVVWAALIGNLLVAVTKLVAALFTSSSAMLAEALHSIIDTTNEVLLLYGMRQSKKRPEPEFPFGHGRELYFWSFIVACLIFTFGGGVALWQGTQRILEPKTLEHPAVIYVVLGLSALFEGTSWMISLRSFLRSNPGIGIWEAVKRSKDPPQFMVLLEDTAALAGIAAAAIGTWLAVTFDEPRFDGAASVFIGLILMAVALVLFRETKSLLIGERADSELAADMMRTIESFEGVEHANGVITTQLAPNQVIGMASIAFDDSLHTLQIEALVHAIEFAVVERHPEIGAFFVKPQTPAAFEAAKRSRYRDGFAPGAA